MHVTKENWSQLLSQLSKIIRHPIAEIHTRDFYAGNGVWRSLSGEQRTQVIDYVFKWFAERKHHLVCTSIRKNLYFTGKQAGEIPAELNTPWKFLGLHLVLAIQKRYQREEKTKGHTIFIFDNEERERMRFSDLISTPPGWSDSYYAKAKKQPRLSHIIDVPYFADSQDVALIQVADFMAFFLRKYIEIKEGLSKEKYKGEMARLDGWIKVLADHCIGSAYTYPARTSDPTSKLFAKYAPAFIKGI